MSIYTKTVCACDVCGRTELAKGVNGRYNETEYVEPDGWVKGFGGNFHICPDCRAKLAERIGKNED